MAAAHDPQQDAGGEPGRAPARAPDGASASARESARGRGELAALRAAQVFSDDLPIAARRAEIAAAIRDHQVVVVCGETGSGKTTQLPRICLAMGRGADGMIGHTQPRRIAARSVAARVAREIAGDGGGSDASRLVGCAIRFDDRTGPETVVKLMTDGILLMETRRDRLLRRYDTIIIDEAHERSLNIDFLLGYLKGILPRRPDLRVIITSATIDPGRFAGHFDDAPVIEVSGRMYPVEVRWRPPTPQPGEDEDAAIARALLDALDELFAEPRGADTAGAGGGARGRRPPGDVLVFLPGEREIREAAESIRGRVGPSVEILPLYARLSAEEQDRVFAQHAGRRVILATNVAETSLTVPGIRFVIDAGLARIGRFSARQRILRLPIEPISQASAKQRAGRCGRVEAGICVRLYDEEAFTRRPAFTDPEILRTSLASVILQMKVLRLGPIEHFPFIDPPGARAIAAGYETLQEIGALDAAGALTETGRMLAHFPIDPRLGRMILEGVREGCLAEVLVVAAFLAVQDPRVRPGDRQGEADLAHARFRHPASDFGSILRLWDAWQGKLAEAAAGTISANAARRWARDSFLAYIRLREWQDVHGQLARLAQRLVGGGAGAAPPRTERRRRRRKAGGRQTP
ncbi:MAG TPA: ATP-dependent RNA helicase HrpA [Phycisphaerales bacterium]|nr:ATP-dependent RNA helicase HrpA [Phycisphaerales bacterium]HMP38110.1 ATP-dependent RNA helicase HrpA [Phycisphaerales bacterium]